MNLTVAYKSLKTKEELRMDKEKDEKVYAFPNIPSPARPVIIDPDICNGCNACVKVCVMGILIPNPKKGKAPLVLFPDECWYDGCCLFHCPEPGAIRLNYPLMWRVPWKQKETGELFWVGTKTPPPPNPKPPV